jgi:hypothetical protein
MSIIGTLPNNIQNGQLEDATPLMANFNFIVNQVNNSGTPLGTLTAPMGTRMLFNQAAPPLGWTQETGSAFQDASVRTVTTAGGGTAGSVAFSQWNFGGTFNVNSFTLSVSQLPSHTHTLHDPGHLHTLGGSLITAGGVGVGGSGTGQTSAQNTATATTGITMDATGFGTAVTPTFTTPQVKLSDYVIGIKS